IYVAPPPPRSLLPGMPEELERIILRCLAKSPSERYQNATELLAALAPWRDLEQSSAPPAEATVVDVPVDSAAPPNGVRPDDAGDGSAPHITVVDESGVTQRRIALTGTGLTIGLLDSNDLVLNAPGVSGHHLFIDWDGRDASVT